MDGLNSVSPPKGCASGGQDLASSSNEGDENTSQTAKAPKPFKTRVEMSEQVKSDMEGAAYTVAYSALKNDVQKLPAMELRAKYAREVNSHRGRKYYAKKNSIPFDPRLSDFRNYLLHLGPCLGDGYTCDRIDPHEGYRPGNVRWACKKQQTENRRITKWLKLPEGGQVTRAQLAAMVGKKTKTVARQLQRGKTVAQVLGETLTGDPIRDWQFPPLVREQWESAFKNRTKFAQVRIDFLIESLARDLNEAQALDMPHEASHLQLMIQGFKGEREQLTERKRQALSTKVVALKDGLYGQPAKPSPLPNLPPPTPAADCAATQARKKSVESKATIEQVLAALRRSGK